jgi:hypothetical protein
VRRASRLRGRAHASQAWRRALLARLLQGWTPPGAPPIPSLGGRLRRRWKRKEKNPDAKRAGSEETGLFDMVNRKRCERRSGKRRARSRQRQRARVPAERAPRRAFLREVPVRAREPGPRGHTTCCLWVPGLAEFTLGPREARTRGLARDTRAEPARGRAFLRPIASVRRSRYIGSDVAIAGRVSHARGTAEYRRRDQAVGRAAEEASLTSTRRARAWPSSTSRRRIPRSGTTSSARSG